MKIDKIILNNFRQYYNSSEIDLTTNGYQNIILIGGKNGYGKTNFLLSLVWGLYGEDISKIDESFKKEVLKEGNYAKFLKGSLNWDAFKEGQFNDLCDIIPFAVAAGKLEEIVDSITLQEESSALWERDLELIEKSNEIVEKLFNAPPFPNDGDIAFSRKTFYADKAKKIIADTFGTLNEMPDAEFEHDLNKSDRLLIRETFDYIRNQSKDSFEQNIDSFNRIKDEILQLDRTIRKMESDLEDEEVIEYTNKKNDALRKIEKLIEEKGSLQNQKDILKRENDKHILSLQVLLKRVSVSEQKRRKLDKANLYIRSIQNFVSEQKRSKCIILEKIIFEEMHLLMHKMNEDSNQNFIAAVKAETLPNNDGLKITLYNSEGEIRAKESLSQGEKQIYISCLIKAILALSIQEFPIFIDTPLSRLDDDHVKQILLHYYPRLASQVVLMATNNEIPPSRFKMIMQNVSKTYLLDNSNNKTRVKPGYFKSYEN